MAAKPGSAFTWATDATYSSGPATGFATKVTIPDAGQALVPGDDLIPEYLNNVLNLVGQYSAWVFDGSSAGAADSHIVETDLSGHTAVQNLTCIFVETDDILVNGDAEVLDDIIFVDNTKVHDIRSPAKTAGNGTQAGQDQRREGGDGQNQTGATNNNRGGSLVDRPGRAGGGGTLLQGAVGMRKLEPSNNLGSLGNTAFWEAACNFVLPSSGAVTVATDDIFAGGGNRTGLLTIDWTARSAGGTNQVVGSRKWMVSASAAGALSFTNIVEAGEFQSAAATEYEQLIGFGGGGPPSVLPGSFASPSGRLGITVTENQAVVVEFCMHVKVLISESI